MNLMKVWFSYRGTLKPMDFLLKGVVPGLLLGLAVVRVDAECDLRGILWWSFFAFSLWPLSAMLAKLWQARSVTGSTP